MVWLVVGLVAPAAIAWLFLVGRPLASAGCAYKAKILCSALFISKRKTEDILATDVGTDDLAPLRHFSWTIDASARTVTVSLWGLISRTVACRPIGGCALQYTGTPDAGLVTIQETGISPPRSHRITPRYDSMDKAIVPAEIDRALLLRALDNAFAGSSDSSHPRTRAVVVLYKGRLIAERYASGLNPDTPLLGWSMTKTVINALTGILVGEGRLSLFDRLPLSLWRDESDPRRVITADQLLRMTSGLQFREDYRSPLKDVVKMLLESPDAAAYAAQKPLHSRPGTAWHYSSGNTNILSRSLREAMGSLQEYLRFPRRALFDPLGMDSAVMETDASGTFVGSSFMYATARDWARLGLLYLRDGVWEGQRILPEGWVDYTVRQTPEAAEAGYAAHVWLRIPKELRPPTARPSNLPCSFHAAGYEGQFISVIPSRHLVVVRLGLTRRPEAWDHEKFLYRILEAIPA